jgi:hypothetical protein
MRDFVPSTFDSMMVDFGRRVERRELYSQIEDEQTTLADTVPTNDERVETEKAARIARLLAQLIQTNSSQDQKMSSKENVLFRRFWDQALRTKAL